MGLVSRRRYRWTGGRVSDYWDEVFTAEGLRSSAALDDQSAFIASLGSQRSERMRDVLGTIQADQDAIIRAGSAGALVVDGGPGTGKTVVALHRTAYLLYSDPRLGHRRGGVLFVGPHQPYLDYVGDVLPSLGEEGVQTCTLRDLVAEGAAATVEPDPEVARLKSSVEMVRAIEPAVRFYERPPKEGMEVETSWFDVWVSADDWAEAFEAPEPGTPHNEARDQVRDALLEILVDKVEDDEVERDQLRRALLGQQGPERGPQPRVAAAGADRPRRRPVVGPRVPAAVRPRAHARRDPGAAARRRPGVDRLRPAAPRRRPAAPRRPRGVPTTTPARGHPRRRARVHGHDRRRPHRHRRLRAGHHVDAPRGRHARQARRRVRAADRRPGRARRPVRARRRGRGPGADRRGVADAAAPLPVAEPDRRRRPRAGPARVRRVVAGAAGAGRAAPGGAGVAEHQLPDAAGGHGGGGAGDPRGAPRRQRADVRPEHRRPRAARTGVGPGRDPRPGTEHRRSPA